MSVTMIVIVIVIVFFSLDLELSVVLCIVIALSQGSSLFASLEMMTEAVVYGLVRPQEETKYLE